MQNTAEILIAETQQSKQKETALMLCLSKSKKNN